MGQESLGQCKRTNLVSTLSSSSDHLGEAVNLCLTGGNDCGDVGGVVAVVVESCEGVVAEMIGFCEGVMAVMVESCKGMVVEMGIKLIVSIVEVWEPLEVVT